jgi:uncharacterized protein YcbK (DUF882 family)
MHLPRNPSVNRRSLLRWLVMGPAALAMALRDKPAAADVLAADRLAVAPRELVLRNLHTDERLEVCYFAEGRYLPEALTQLNRLLRDHRSGDVAAIDPRLFDVLHGVAGQAQCSPQYEIISGYRSPATNQKLRAKSEGVAQHSLHMDGRAVDVRLPTISCSHLRDVALALRLGGVGYYAHSNFVHLDTGRLRSWVG